MRSRLLWGLGVVLVRDFLEKRVMRRVKRVKRVTCLSQSHLTTGTASQSQSRCPVGVLFRHALFMPLVQSSSPLVLYLGWAHGRKNGVTCKLGVWGVYYPQIVRGQLEYKKK